MDKIYTGRDRVRATRGIRRRQVWRARATKPPHAQTHTRRGIGEHGCRARRAAQRRWVRLPAADANRGERRSVAERGCQAAAAEGGERCGVGERGCQAAAAESGEGSGVAPASAAPRLPSRHRCRAALRRQARLPSHRCRALRAVRRRAERGERYGVALPPMPRRGVGSEPDGSAAATGRLGGGGGVVGGPPEGGPPPAPCWRRGAQMAARAAAVETTAVSAAVARRRWSCRHLSGR